MWYFFCRGLKEQKARGASFAFGVKPQIDGDINTH